MYYSFNGESKRWKGPWPCNFNLTCSIELDGKVNSATKKQPKIFMALKATSHGELGAPNQVLEGHLGKSWAKCSDRQTRWVNCHSCNLTHLKSFVCTYQIFERTSRK